MDNSEGKLRPTKRLFEILLEIRERDGRMDAFKDGLEENLLDFKKSFKARKGDLFVATYPKCGSTWTQQIVKLVRNHGQEDGNDVEEMFPWVDVMSVHEANVRNVLYNFNFLPHVHVVVF